MDKRKKVLFVQPSFDLPQPRNIRTANIVEHLKKDFDITILAFQCKGSLRNIDQVKVERLPMSFHSRYIFNKSDSGYNPRGIVRLMSRAMSYVGNKFFGFPDVWIWEQKKLFNYIKKTAFSPDVVVCSIVPFSTGGLIAKVKRKGIWNETKIIYDIGDPLSHNAIDKVVSSRKLDFEKKILTFSDKVILTNIGTKTHYAELFNYPLGKMSIIPQGVNVNLLEQVDRDDKQIVKDKIVLVYGGAFYKDLRDPGQFIMSLKREDIRKKVFVKIFSGNLNRFGKINEKDPLVNKGRVSQKELLESYKNADVLLYFDNAYGLQTSGKIYELLALKKPILFIYSNEDSPVYIEVKKYTNIFFCKNNKNAIADKILMMDKEKLSSLKIDYNILDFSWAKRADSFKEILLEN